MFSRSSSILKKQHDPRDDSLSQFLALYRVCSPRYCPTEGKFKESKPFLINSDLYFYPQPVLKMFLFLAPAIRLRRTLACSRGCRSLWLKYKLLQFFSNLALQCWLVALIDDLPPVYQVIYPINRVMGCSNVLLLSSFSLQSSTPLTVAWVGDWVGGMSTWMMYYDHPVCLNENDAFHIPSYYDHIIQLHKRGLTILFLENNNHILNQYG